MVLLGKGARVGRGYAGRRGARRWKEYWGSRVFGGRQSLSQIGLVQGFLFYPDGRVDGKTPPVLATQHILAELRRVHTASA